MANLRIGYANDVDASGGYVVERYKDGKWRPISRVYGSYSEAENDLNRRSSARERYYERLGDVTISYYPSRNFIDTYEIPTGTPPDEEGGTNSGRGFYRIMFSDDVHWDPDKEIPLSYIKTMMDPYVESFLRSAAIQYPDEHVRLAISQYFFS